MEEKLSVTDVLRLHSIFTANDWFSKPGQSEKYENFAKMLVNFTEEQKALIFELTGRFLWVGFNEYLDLLIKTLNKVESTRLSGIKRIICFPIIKPSDIGKVKSSSPLLYLFKSSDTLSSNYRDKQIQVVDSYKVFDKIVFTNDDLLFLVDDYVGTGDTLRATLSEISKNPTLDVKKVNVITLVTQGEIVKEAAILGISYYAGHIRNKGISDEYSSPDLERNIAIMEEIETYIPALSSYSFGYKKSEALVRMHRTPNNTFPIFWMNHKRGGKTFQAPFPR